VRVILVINEALQFYQNAKWPLPAYLRRRENQTQQSHRH